MSKDFSFSFAKNVREFVILRRNIRKIRSFCKFCRVSLKAQRAKTKFKVTRAQKFKYMQEYCSTNDSNIRLLGVRHKDLKCRYGNCGIQ